MACYRPLEATRLRGGNLIVHKRTPGTKRKPTPPHLGDDLKLPCGRCIGCKIDHGMQWATRCLHESQLHNANCALTLTYSDDPNYTGEIALKDWTRPHQDVWTIQKSTREFSTIAQDGLRGPNVAHVDNSRSNKERRVELSKSDHQKFMKRLRERVGPVRFYMCGEYGDRLARPHYHYLIFGYDFPDKRYFKTSLSGTKLYRSPELEKIWTAGHAWIGELDYSTCAYVAAYVMKKIGGEKAIDHYRRTDEAGNDFWLTPEFAYMSRHPGIGKNWWDKYHTDVTSTDGVWRHSTKTKPPRYYDKLLEKLDTRLYESIKNARIERAKTKEEDSPARLYAKEAVQTARVQLKQRNIK